MQLIYAETVAIVFGLAAHSLLPRRDLTGVLLLPAVAGVACAVVWVALTWARVEQGGATMWIASLLAAIVAPIAVGVPIRGSRHRRDESQLANA